ADAAGGAARPGAIRPRDRPARSDARSRGQRAARARPSRGRGPPVARGWRPGRAHQRAPRPRELPRLDARRGGGPARHRSRRERRGAGRDHAGRGGAEALQAPGRVVADSDAALLARARELLGHADPAVRSVAADLLARRPDVADVDRLVTAYQRAAGDPFDDARLSAVAALGA